MFYNLGEYALLNVIFFIWNLVCTHLHLSLIIICIVVLKVVIAIHSEAQNMKFIGKLNTGLLHYNFPQYYMGFNITQSGLGKQIVLKRLSLQTKDEISAD